MILGLRFASAPQNNHPGTAIAAAPAPTAFKKPRRFTAPAVRRVGRRQMSYAKWKTNKKKRTTDSTDLQRTRKERAMARDAKQEISLMRSHSLSAISAIPAIAAVHFPRGSQHSWRHGGLF